MSMSRFILGMATVASLMFINLGCEEVDATCPGTTCSSTVDGSLNQADGGSLGQDSTKQDANSSDASNTGPDQSVAELAPDVNSDPCAEWRWLIDEVGKWWCSTATDSEIKLELSVENGVCMAESKVFSRRPASELICEKQKKEFSFLVPEINNKKFTCIPWVD